MKKSNLRNQELEGKKRRLTLSRETIKALEEPVLLTMARGGEFGIFDLTATDRPTECT